MTLSQGIGPNRVQVDLEAASESGVGVPSQGSPKRRKTELLLGGARDRPVKETVAPEPITGTTPRGKRKRAHKPVVDAKRTRKAAAAFDGTDTDEDGPTPAGPASFPPRWRSRIIQ